MNQGSSTSGGTSSATGDLVLEGCIGEWDMDLSPAERSIERDRARLSVLDRLSLFAIAVVLLMVTLPRLEIFALRANERGAIQALDLIAPVAAARPGLPLGELFTSSPELEHSLHDVELLEGGRVLRRHGYLIARIGNGRLGAWPWEHGRTGLGVFLTDSRGVVGNANSEARWSGPGNAPELADLCGGDWRVLPH